MKKLFLIVVMLVLAGCAGMERAADAGKPIEFVLDVPGKTKDQLFSASKSWIAETFVSGKSVIDDADKDSGRIIAKGNIKHPCEQAHGCLMNVSIGFTLRIDTRDGKLKATYTNATVIHPPTNGYAVGMTYVQGSAGSESAIFMTGDLADAKKAFKNLSDELQHYAANESATAKSW